jgi:hypothetical protein
MSKQAKHDNAVALGVKIFAAIIMSLIVLFGWFVKPDGAGSSVDIEFLWDAVHPASVLNIIGLVLLFISILGLTGFSKWVFGVLSMPEGSSWILDVLSAGGILGVILTFA